jgi:uncharacterized lipoprotein YajG
MTGKHIKTIIFFLIIAILLSSCQKTPDYAPVVNKADGEFQNKIAASPVVNSEITNETRWEESFSLKKTECQINAEIVIPKMDAHPVYKVKQQTFDESLIKGLTEYFTKGAAGMRDSSDTKEDFIDRLIYARKGTFNPETNK